MLLSGESIIKAVLASLGTGISFLFGNWTGLLSILVALVILDYATGILASYIKGSLSSSVGLRGIAKKVFMFAIVAVANLLDTLLGDTMILRNITVFFYIANELLSILENAIKAGIPVPEKVKKAILILNEEQKKD